MQLNSDSGSHFRVQSGWFLCLYRKLSKFNKTTGIMLKQKKYKFIIPFFRNTYHVHKFVCRTTLPVHGTGCDRLLTQPNAALTNDNQHRTVNSYWETAWHSKETHNQLILEGNVTFKENLNSVIIYTWMIRHITKLTAWIVVYLQ